MFPVFRIGHRQQTSFQLRFENVILRSRLHDSLRFAAAKVHVHLAQPHGIRARFRPVDVFPKLSLIEQHLHCALFHLHAALQHEVAVHHQPCVVVHRFPERCESVIGEHDQRGVMRIRGAHRIADDRIHQLICTLECIPPLRHERLVVRRMLRIHQAPEHVRDSVRKFELLDEQIIVPVEEGIEHLAVLRDAPCHVIPKHLFRRKPLGNRPGVDLPADRLVQPVLLRQLRRPGGWRRDFESGRQMARIEIDRRQIQPHFGLRGNQMKAADSVQLDQGIERKNEFHPAAPFVRPQREFLSAHLDVDRIPVIRHGDAHRNRYVRRSSE